MFDHVYYVPILKGKEGEYRSLAELNPNIRSKIIPLIEIPAIGKYETKNLDSHLKKAVEKIYNSWGTGNFLFLDLSLLSSEQKMKDNTSPYLYILKNILDKRIKIIPVAGLNHTELYNEYLRNCIKTQNYGLCLRVGNHDFADLKNKIDIVINDLNLAPKNIDIIIDFRDIFPNQTETISTAAKNVINTFPYLHEWRSFTVAATAFPLNMSRISYGITSLPRSEWKLWRNLVTDNSVKRIPSYGDYSIAHPDIVEIDPRIMDRSANIRYTTEDSWLILKGRSVKKIGSGQYSALCQTLINKPEYSGADFSWGDNYINECAEKRVGMGNATTWRIVGNSHHFAFIVNQLSSFSLS